VFSYCLGALSRNNNYSAVPRWRRNGFTSLPTSVLGQHFPARNSPGNPTGLDWTGRSIRHHETTQGYSPHFHPTCLYHLPTNEMLRHDQPLDLAMVCRSKASNRSHGRVFNEIPFHDPLPPSYSFTQLKSPFSSERMLPPLALSNNRIIRYSIN
jgi:hypothetical protein